MRVATIAAAPAALAARSLAAAPALPVDVPTHADVQRGVAMYVNSEALAPPRALA